MTSGSAQYVLKRVGKRGNTSSTRVARGSVSAFIKFDSLNEYPDTVYNEIVANQLGNRLGVPVANGVLVHTSQAPLFASLELCINGSTIPNLPKKHIETCANLYPDQVARLMVFDIWIGNFDRFNNLKASINPNQSPCFSVFDHSHCLLTAAGTRKHSLSQLSNGYLIVNHHPFYHHAPSVMSIAESVRRISNLAASDIEECCWQPTLIDKVDECTQRALAKALNIRRIMLMTLVEQNIRIITFGNERKGWRREIVNRIKRGIREKRKMRAQEL